MALSIGHQHSYTRDEIIRFIDLIWPYMSGVKTWSSQDEEWEFHDRWVERRPQDKN